MNSLSHSCISNETCEELHHHEAAVQEAELQMPDDEMLLEASDFFKAFSDSSRLKIIAALVSRELCVCDLCEIVGQSQSAVSHQLRVLRGARIVKFRRDGKQVFYSIDDSHIAEIILTTIRHLSEE
ncbi:MAG: ArsR/SmtB family transcription factor [Candidatus Merdivicinus sp.]